MSGPRGARNGNWRGGRTINYAGYVVLAIDGKKVFEHVVVAERALGKPLPGRAEVHHVDRNRARNIGGNLVLCEDHEYHGLLHRRQRALDECGDANAKRCHYCRRYDRQDEIKVTTRGRDGYERAYHPSCARQKTADRAVRAQGVTA